MRNDNPSGAPMRLNAYTVQEFDAGNGQKARSWTRIGVAFPHKDGTGFNVELNALPLDGRIVLFPPQADDRAEEEPAVETSPPAPQAPSRPSHARRR